MKITFAAALLLACSASSAADPTTVLGLPLGGKIKPKKGCNFASAKKYSESGLCWVYTTSGGKSGTSGQLHVPGEDKRPSWAAHAEFKADVSADGTLRELTVLPMEFEDPGAIIESISARFGHPSYSQLRPPIKWYATWDKPEISISLLCKAGEKCYIRFASAELAATERKWQAERAKIDSARPASP